MYEQPDFTEPQMEEVRRIVVLLTGYIHQTLTRGQQHELDEWIAASDQNRMFFEEVTNQEKIQQTLAWLDQSDAPEKLKALKAQLQFTAKPGTVRLRKVWPYAIAASFIIIAGIAIQLIFSEKPDPAVAPIIAEKQQDVPAPNEDKATLTLADGTVITLEQAKDGELATQGNALVSKQAGQLVYHTGAGSTPNTALFNTVKTPRGGSYPLTLSDGTRLWLNAASSIRFPAAFTGHERRVAITGEVYFEVAKNAAKPFRVEIEEKGTVVEVLGTHFNVNAYTDESISSTTLLEGSVKVLAGTKELILKPGQQARLSSSGSLDKITGIDTDEAIAWQKGLFQFTNADIRTLMRQLSRWYDIDVSYEGNLPGILTTGKAPRNISLANLLKILSLSGVRYKIKGKKLTIFS